jgi:Carboxypeptidase regulatory-like domain/TonB-dependent Receptor Plug Domain
MPSERSAKSVNSARSAIRSSAIPKSVARAACVPLSLALLLAAVTSVASSQSVGGITGTVRDTAGAPIAGVEILNVTTHVLVRSDSTGLFRFANVPIGSRQISFRRFGFEPKVITTDVKNGFVAPIIVVLDALAVELPGMLVAEDARKRQLLVDFYDRKARGFGHFITREEIEQRNPANLSDMMRMIPGTRLIPNRNGGTATLRFARATGGRDCPPQYWVDGVKTWGLNIDDIIPQDVEGIEIYAGPSGLPPQFNTREGTTICGTVLIWTRIPGA